MVTAIVTAFFVIMAILVVWSVVGIVLGALLSGFKDDSPKYGTEAERRFYSTRR